MTTEFAFELVAKIKDQLDTFDKFHEEKRVREQIAFFKGELYVAGLLWSGIPFKQRFYAVYNEIDARESKANRDSFRIVEVDNLPEQRFHLYIDSADANVVKVFKNGEPVGEIEVTVGSGPDEDLQYDLKSCSHPDCAALKGEAIDMMAKHTWKTVRMRLEERANFCGIEVDEEIDYSKYELEELMEENNDK